MSRRSVILAIGAALLALSGAAAWWISSRPSLPDNLLEATPHEATAIVQVHVSRLLESKAFDQLIHQRGHDRGMREVTKLCGENPLAQIEAALVFALPPARGGLPEWGALLRGDLNPRKLAQCVKKTLEAHSRVSKLSQDDIEGVPCVVSSRGDSRACAVTNGLVVGTDRSTRAAIVSLLGKARSARTREDLLARWRDLDPSADARGVAFVPENTRALLRRLVKPLLPADLAPLTDVTAGAGQLFARESLRGHVLLDTPSASDAQAAAKAVNRLLKRLLRVPALAMTPAAKLVDATQVRATGSRVRFEGDYPLHALGLIIDLLPTARRLLMPPGPAAAPSKPDTGKRDAGP